MMSTRKHAVIGLSSRGLSLLAALALIAVPVMARQGAEKTWTFENDEPGKIAKDFQNEVGTWEVVKDGGNGVLYQKAKNENAVYNVALVRPSSYKDVDLSVRLKPVAGELDQGGGLVWRAKDKASYYICRFNPLEDNYRLYKVEKGKRTQLADAKVPGDEQWHTLRATMVGSKMTCYLDGKPLLEADDSTFTEAGMVGLWSKADAQSYFDDLTVHEE
ncbi:family 16 glycoside hydrolase [Singulisphaera acidiphila]|uniref:3-keto-alpha-glucoside-1,2-lyase/3-keto-2-hydroxy-glucal hydratase domain-containing protein n=1 Tax=Singulisphaera acidiphila (strain ATCC BAA-1392 / DSM 18658 / VKM B-2454 / MOB10) TaxID=886293 RepID=L0DIK3_SINAD|nr:family 16 glycoside hydrolase [Singulisphaera acidiphila]AGA29087.1 protein of unknown function (DUF1080) [Singulisphaera acidiphila DSM 18658]